MMHKRRWCVSPVAAPQELALMLTERTWTLCSGFYVQGHENYLFLNDATHEDGAAEFGIVAGGMAGPHIQVESITFSWCSRAKAMKFIVSAINGLFNHEGHPVTIQLQTPEQHGKCHLCE